MADKLNADRISRMVDAVLKAAGGDYSVRLDTDDKENDVLASLAEAINNMLGATGEQISNMRQSEAGCRQVVEAINDALAVCDANGVLTYANQHFCEILSARTEELIGSKFVDLLGETNRNRWLEQQERRKQGIATSYQLEIPSRDGSNILCAASDSALVDNDGRLIGSICVLTDITQRRREEEALRMFQFSIDQAPVLACVLANSACLPASSAFVPADSA